VSSGHIPPKDEPGPDEILRALREADFENPRLGRTFGVSPTTVISWLKKGRASQALCTTL
jgi:hypothetical protein